MTISTVIADEFGAPEGGKLEVWSLIDGGCVTKMRRTWTTVDGLTPRERNPKRPKATPR